ncbi:MAG: hypothetical protein MI725_14735, partial [Pirellulales bacterium]|nr:hypothetical protein [Pirellulales bacterium]
AAALVGLERHARLGIASEESARRVTKAALAVIADTEPEEEVSTDVHHWMKCMAARVLSRQFADGPTVEVQTALTGLIADDKMNLEDRCCVASLLDNMKFEAATDIDGAAAVVALGQLTQDVVEEEAKESEDFEKEALRHSPSTRGGGRYDASLEGPKYPRSRLLNRLISINSGADSLSKGLQEGDKQNLQALTDALDPVITIVADKNSLDLDITPSVQTMKRTIDSLVNSWKPPAAEAAEEAEAGFAG